MTKENFIAAVHEVVHENHPSISKKDVEELWVAACDTIAAELLGGGEVVLGKRDQLGKLKVLTRSARKGRNPRTGEEINIPASHKVVFVTAKALKEALNGQRNLG